MSKTDKTRPAWVQMYDPTIATYIEHNHCRGVCIVDTLEEFRELQLPRWRTRPLVCYRQFAEGRAYSSRFYGGGPPKEFRNLLERGLRARTRGPLHEAARDYNANGDTDIEPFVPFVRNARWLWD